MNLFTRTLLISTCVQLIGLGSINAKEQGSLSQCQQIKKQIDYYTDKRREGGSSSAMKSWRKSRTKYEDQFSDLRCRKWRSQLD